MLRPPGNAEDARIQGFRATMRRSSTLHRHSGRRRPRQRGQSVVEFTLVVPILLVLFIAIADFGRIFAAGIAVEAATRDAAEAVANEYLSNPPGPLDSPAPSGNQPYYDNLHAYGQGVVCAELRGLPNTDCSGVPAVVICVHDGQDGACGSSTGNSASCGDFTPAATNSQNSTTQRWVEVRTCYHFTPILQLPLFAFGDVWLQRTRNFTIPCYFVLGQDECG
jgi:hypothetical protein